MQVGLVVLGVAVAAAGLGLVAEAASQGRWGWVVAMFFFPPAVLPYAFGWRSREALGD